MKRNQITAHFSGELILSAVVYIAFFYFNDWVTGYLEYSKGVNWVYLPAGMRLFLVLIFALPGAFGIAIASFLISYCGGYSYGLITCIGIGFISGFAPYFARMVVVSNDILMSDLNNLNLYKLLACILIFALISSGLHQCWFIFRDLNSGSLDNWFVMFVGDVVGSILVVALIKQGVDVYRSYQSKT